MKPFLKVIAFVAAFMSVAASLELHGQNKGLRIKIDNQQDSSQPVALFQLDEVTVVPGLDPAYRIIDSVTAHRDDHNPDRLASYSYTIYDKMVFTVDSAKFAQLKSNTANQSVVRFDSILQENDLMVMETLSEMLFLSPDKKKQTVKATKMSGVKDPVFIYLTENFQSVSFYDDYVVMAGSNYLNPLSSRNKTKYNFYLQSTSPLENDTLFFILFWPLEEALDDGLQGQLTVHTDGWAVQQVKAVPAHQGGIYSIEIQQFYEKFENHWFPKEYAVNLVFPNVKLAMNDVSVPMAAIGRSYLSDIHINKPIDPKLFSNLVLEVDPEAYFRDDAYWSLHRLDSLDSRTLATYRFFESISDGTDIFDRYMSLVSKTLEFKLPVGPIDIDLEKILSYSILRGFFMGLGLETNERVLEKFRVRGSFGYWTRLKRFDYDVGATWLINPMQQMELDLDWQIASDVLGEFGGMMEDSDNLLTENNYKFTFFENVYLRQRALTLSFSTRFAQHFKAFVSLKNIKRSYGEQFYLDSLAPPIETASLSLAEVKLRFAFNEKFAVQGKNIRSLGTNYPIVWLTYQHCFPDVLGSDYEFDRFKFQISKSFKTKYLGVSDVLLQAGYASAGCPVMETFNILSCYLPMGLYSPGCFNTMRFDEFFCDRFVALFLSHNFGGQLWRTNSRWFKPELTLATHFGWGDMRRADAFPGKNFRTMEKGYFESGVVVDGLLRISMLKMGLGVFYRYGPYAFGSFKDDIALKYSLVFDF